MTTPVEETMTREPKRVLAVLMKEVTVGTTLKTASTAIVFDGLPPDI